MSAPWLAREEWAQRRIKDENARMAGCVLVFAVLWTLISSGTAAAVIAQAGGIGDVVFVLIFPAVGLLLVSVGAYLMLHRRRFAGRHPPDRWDHRSRWRCRSPRTRRRPTNGIPATG